jgi:hypothetical protein
MGVVKKTGVMAPRVSLAYERSQILARVQEDLNIERVRVQQKINRSKSRLARRACSKCLANGFKLMMKEYMLERHMLNHRVLQALGQEKEWILELRKKYEERLKKFKGMAKIGREHSNINRIKKAKIRSEWLWQRTILKPKKEQRINIAWLTLKMGEPIWVVPVSVWPKSHRLRLPDELARAWEVCYNFIERLIESSFDMDEPEKVALLVSRWLSVSDKEYISERCYVDTIIKKEVIQGHILSFVKWMIYESNIN